MEVVVDVVRALGDAGCMIGIAYAGLNESLDFKGGALSHSDLAWANRNSLGEEQVAPRARVTDPLWDSRQPNLQCGTGGIGQDDCQVE